MKNAEKVKKKVLTLIAVDDKINKLLNGDKIFEN